MVDIVLVRHASTAWSGRRYCGRGDPRLSAMGRAEAAALAERLVPSLPPGTRLISSPSRRALATAQAIAVAGDFRQIECDERWLEVDFGLAEGRTFEELEAIDPATTVALLAGAMDIDWPDGETSGSLAARVAAAWNELAAAGCPAVVVTHAGPILQVLGLTGERPVDLAHLPGPATATRLTLTAGRASGAPVLPSAS
jgi:ribonuclease H / adenosylcobalamin/alpha-ribazole phosphatase